MSNNKLNIRSMNTNFRDEHELATIVYTNGNTGVEYSASIWHTMDNVIEEKITLFNIQDTELYVVMNEPEFDVMEYDSLLDGLYNHQVTYILEDLITVDRELEDILVDYHNGDIKEFDINIPKEKQILDQDIIVARQEIMDILEKSALDEIEKEDLVELGKVLEGVELNYNYYFPEQEPDPKDSITDFGLENNFNKALVVTNIKEEEIPYLNLVFEKLNVEANLNFEDNIDKFKDKKVVNKNIDL